MIFGDSEIMNFESTRIATRKPNTSHSKTYSHPAHLRELSSKVEMSRAINRARAWHEDIMLDYETVEPYFQENVASPAESDQSIRRWLVDTGCPFDLVSQRDLSEEERKYMSMSSKSLYLNTANGRAESNLVLSLRTPTLSDGIDAHVMSSTPNSISLGKRCMTMGYSFVWRA